MVRHSQKCFSLGEFKKSRKRSYCSPTFQYFIEEPDWPKSIFWHGRAKNAENILLFLQLFNISRKIVICRSIHKLAYKLKKGMTWKVCLIGRWRDYKRPDYFWTFYWFWAPKLKSETPPSAIYIQWVIKAPL